jgi:hypothetical protein
VAIFAKTCEQGAQTTIYCAVSEKVGGETGLYYRLDLGLAVYNGDLIVLQVRIRFFGLRQSICDTAMKVGPCHHGMARPQAADGGTASDMEGSCE